MQDATLLIAGMTCGGCVNSVTRVLRDLPGVDQVSVTLLPSQAVVRFDEQRVDIEALAGAIREAGFTVTGLK
jgi:copper chaperone